MLEGLAGKAASIGQRTGSCCCSCCTSAVSVGEPGGQVPSNCLSAGQLRYTVSWSVMTLLLPILFAAPAFVGEWGGELRGSRLEAWMKSHKSEVAIT